MGSIQLHVSMSLDGYTAGPDVSMANPMGEGGEALHAWLGPDPDPVDADVAAAMFSTDTVGSVLMGRRTLDVGIRHWGDDGTFAMPCFVVTNRPHEPIVKGETTFTFVTDGLESAVAQARAAADDKAVNVMGANVTRQLLISGVIDMIEVNLVPIILGGGTSLFGALPANGVRLEQLDARSSDSVHHLRYRVSH